MLLQRVYEGVHDPILLMRIRFSVFGMPCSCTYASCLTTDRPVADSHSTVFILVLLTLRAMTNDHLISHLVSL